ncbi:MAG: geranylgeranyl reductase family protein [Vulcanimicrobiaceae bacterium]
MRVAVIGAGPAGAIAARSLARDGAAVTLYERAAWPRPKACGDGLTPASVALLRSLEIALPDDRPFATTLVSGPRETAFRAPWPAAYSDGTTLERVRFDALLVDAAIASGVRFEDRVTVLACSGGRVRMRSRAGASADVAYDTVVLAEGATGALGAACGFGRFARRLVAYRGYVSCACELAREYEVHYACDVLPGYAWIFPVAAQRANVGAVLATGGDVRARLRRWLATSSFARERLGERIALEEGRGGIVTIGRARRYRERVFAVGDAAGIADPLSAEGVSQAMTSGTLVARAMAAERGDPARAGAAYERALTAFDRNNREALRIRALFASLADPMIALARARPRFAAHVVAAGYFPKTDLGWFARTVAALR